MRYSLGDQLVGWMKAAGMTQVACRTWLDNSFFVVYRSDGKRSRTLTAATSSWPSAW